MNQASCKGCGEISPICYCDFLAPICAECGEYLTGFALDHEQKVCSDCQELLDAKT
mgnify:CR=1 FL=1